MTPTPVTLHGFSVVSVDGDWIVRGRGVEFNLTQLQADRDRAVEALRAIADLSWPDNNPDETMGRLLGLVHVRARAALEGTDR